MRLRTLLTASSLALVSCGGPERPDTNLCIVNAKARHKSCFNMKRDYDDQGNLLPGVKPSIVPIASLDDLDKNLAVDPDGSANLKAYIQKLRERDGGCNANAP